MGTRSASKLDTVFLQTPTEPHSKMNLAARRRWRMIKTAQRCLRRSRGGEWGFLEIAVAQALIPGICLHQVPQWLCCMPDQSRTNAAIAVVLGEGRSGVKSKNGAPHHVTGSCSSSMSGTLLEILTCSRSRVAYLRHFHKGRV